MKKPIVLSVCVALVFGLSFTPSAVASDEDDVLKVAEDFVKAFNSSDLELMSSLHSNSPKATRFGPSKRAAFLMQGGESIIEYRKSLLTSTAGALVFSIHNAQATLVGDDVAVITFYNTPTYTDPITKEQTIKQARVTFIVQKIGGKWLIVHEHSSYLPVE